MPSWINLAVPIAMSIASSFITASYMTGKNVEKVALMDEQLKKNIDDLKAVSERVAKLEGVNSAKQ